MAAQSKLCLASPEEAWGVVLPYLQGWWQAQQGLAPLLERLRAGYVTGGLFDGSSSAKEGEEKPSPAASASLVGLGGAAGKVAVASFFPVAVAHTAVVTTVPYEAGVLLPAHHVLAYSASGLVASQVTFVTVPVLTASAIAARLLLGAAVAALSIRAWARPGASSASLALATCTCSGYLVSLGSDTVPALAEHVGLRSLELPWDRVLRYAHRVVAAPLFVLSLRAQGCSRAGLGRTARAVAAQVACVLGGAWASSAEGPAAAAAGCTAAAAYACSFEALRAVREAPGAKREPRGAAGDALAALAVGGAGVAELLGEAWGRDVAWGETAIYAMRVLLLARGCRCPLLLYGYDSSPLQHVYAATGSLLLTGAEHADSSARSTQRARVRTDDAVVPAGGHD